MTNSCTHFVGFTDDTFNRAIKVFGRPDFVHRYWDGRAKSMIGPCDRAIFSKGTDQDVPTIYSFDDSGVF